MLETFYDLEELEDAIEAVRSVSALPIVALLTFDERRRDARRRQRRARPPSASPRSGSPRSAPTTAPGLLAALHGARADAGGGRPLAALPNIGLASLLGGRVIYPHATPEYFAEFAAHARDLGARVIGGCCGTTPTEIAAIRAAIDADRPARIRLDARRAPRSRSPSARSCARRGSPGRSATGEFVVSVQLDPPLGGSSRGPDRGRAARSRPRASSASSTSTTTRPRAPASAR